MPDAIEQLAAQDSFEDVVFDGIAAGPDVNVNILAGKELYRCTFRNIKVHELRWARTRLEDCVFESCDLSRANVAQLALRDVQFKHCKLMGIDWSNVASYPVMSFEDCSLRYASFVRLTLNKTHFTRCTLSESNFIESHLVDASFEGCELSGARFERCDLRQASFADTQGLLLDAKSNNVKGARIPVDAALRMVEALGLRIAQ